MYTAPPGGIPDPFLIASQGGVSLGELAIGIGSSTLTSGAWTSASLALFVPFRITGRRRYRRALVANGTAVSGNFDIGVYDFDGARKFSTGGTAQSGTSVAQAVDIDWTLDPGHYLLALVLDNNTGQTSRGPPYYGFKRSMGSRQMASAYPLPATATFAADATSYLPVWGISEMTWA